MSLFVDIQKKVGKFNLNVAFETNGGVLGLLGASGSGKSMTLKCVAGVEKPDRGRIALDGVTFFDSERGVNLRPQERRVGYLFQNYALFPHMTVRQNVLCGLRRERDKPQRERVLREILDLLGLPGLEERRPSQISGGQQQRVALARILAGKPNLLMLDEPFNALDSHLRGQLQVQTRRLLGEYGKETLIVTHDRDEAYRLCERIVFIDEGRGAEAKKTGELFANPESRQAAYLTGCKNVEDARRMGEYEVEVPLWGVRLRTALPVRDGLCAVAARAHSFTPDAADNRYPVRFTGEMEEPFETILHFRYESQSPDSPDLWLSVSKDKRNDARTGALGIAPEDVMPLYR